MRLEPPLQRRIGARKAEKDRSKSKIREEPICFHDAPIELLRSRAPQSIADLVDHVVARILDQFGLAASFARRWEGTRREGRKALPPEIGDLTHPR